MEEIIEHFIVIGGADQAADRKSHSLGKIGCQDISEVSGGNCDVDFLSLLNLTVFQEFSVRIHIIHDLRHKTSDIDGVGGGEDKAPVCQFSGKLPVSKNLFHSALGIVKVSGDRCHCRILSPLRHHLKLLHPAHSALGIEYDNLRPRHIRKAGHSCLSRIPGSSRQDYNGLICPVFSGCRRHQMGQNRQRHILKCNRTSVKQFQIIGAVCLCKRSNLLCIKFGVIGTADAVSQLLLSKIRKKELHHLICRFLIAHA